VQRQVLDGSLLKERAPAELEDRFFWNYSLAQPLIESDAGRFVTPVIYGHFSSSPLNHGQQTFEFVLISRRHRKRVGLRYTRRGADQQGNTANYVETEQILVSNSKAVSSFVQTRGSIPILWKQVDIALCHHCRDLISLTL